MIDCILTDVFSVSAVDVEGVVTLLLERTLGLEEQPVGAELRLGHAVPAGVVEVALLRVGEVAVRLGTLELCAKDGQLSHIPP